MDQRPRRGRENKNWEVADLLVANAKCHIICCFCVVDCDNRKLYSRVKGPQKGSVTIIVFYVRGSNWAAYLTVRKVAHLSFGYQTCHVDRGCRQRRLG